MDPEQQSQSLLSDNNVNENFIDNGLTSKPVGFGNTNSRRMENKKKEKSLRKGGKVNENG